MKNYSFVDQDYELWVLLHQPRDAVFKAREKELSPYGISTMQAAVLFIILAIGNEATPTEISRWLLREPHSVSNLLSRMEKEGLVTKDGKDNRIVHNSLIENLVNAMDAGEENIWDYGGQGNYWSDYKGSDKDDDGIGDAPYRIDKNGIDKYPLMEPYLR